MVKCRVYISYELSLSISHKKNLFADNGLRIAEAEIPYSGGN